MKDKETVGLNQVCLPVYRITNTDPALVLSALFECCICGTASVLFPLRIVLGLNSAKQSNWEQFTRLLQERHFHPELPCHAHSWIDSDCTHFSRIVVLLRSQVVEVSLVNQ